MRILLVSNMYPTAAWPGYGVFVRNFKNGLSGFFNVDLAVIRGKPSSKPNKIIKYFNFFCDFYGFYLKNEYDLIYVHYVTHSLLPLLLLNQFKRINDKLVVNFHGEDLLPRNVFEKTLFKLSYRFINKKVALIVVPSNYFKGIATKLWPNKKIFVSPSGGVNLDIFKPRQKKTFSNYKDLITLGYISRLDPGKGWDTFLKAIYVINQTYSKQKFCLKVLGKGSELINFNSMVLDLKLENIVQYQAALNQSELPAFYSSLDAFIFPSELPESLGLVGLEALACGIPAICSKTGGIEDYMIDNLNGFLFSPGDHIELASAIRKFINLSTSEIDNMRQAALSTAEAYEYCKISNQLNYELLNIIKG